MNAIFCFLNLALILSCSNANKISKSNQIVTKDGIIIFSSLNMDYFFPFVDTMGINRNNYYTKDFGAGFLLTNVSPSLKNQLKNQYSDTMYNSFNYPVTNILPVRIEYFENLNSVAESKDTLCIIFNNEKKSCLIFDVNQRFVKSMTPRL